MVVFDIELERAERQFFDILLDFNYADEGQMKHLVSKAKLHAQKIPMFSDWPQNDKQFWDAEALFWNGRMEREVRDSIRAELSHLHGKNLDLAAGSVSYVPYSVAVDFSEEMLHLNPAQEKVVANLEEKLPFADELFDSATLVFGVNYIQNIAQLFAEVHRMLKPNGRVVIVQAPSVSALHKLHYKNSVGDVELRVLLGKLGFRVRSQQKELHGRKLLFVDAEKTSL
ncbi:MAG TPA: class I SAM-dependent methyltransferase [Candidatus Nanoarchaeia archaeon]|nr:class I SAM-dependent methyltransferase [Candidatus Nanoarchaeia archaeon]